MCKLSPPEPSPVSSPRPRHHLPGPAPGPQSSPSRRGAGCSPLHTLGAETKPARQWHSFLLKLFGCWIHRCDLPPTYPASLTLFGMMGIFLAYVGFVFFSVLYIQQGLSSQGKSELTGKYTFARGVCVCMCVCVCVSLRSKNGQADVVRFLASNKE